MIAEILRIAIPLSWKDQATVLKDIKTYQKYKSRQKHTKLGLEQETHTANCRVLGTNSQHILQKNIVKYEQFSLTLKLQG